MAQLIVALDYTNAEDALATAESLRGCPIWMKVGLELFTHEGPAVVKKLKDMGFKVMLDLKMFDIPNTVAGGVRSACLMGVDLITLHALGGERMIHAAVDAVRQSAEEGGPKPLLFAVTVLTSMAPGELPGYGENLSGLAADLAAGGQAWGLDGVVCSGHEVEAIKSRCPGLMCLTPGIRPASGSASDDQRRIMTPAQAVRIGSDFLVVGRPITKAPVPADAARAILDEARDTADQVFKELNDMRRRQRKEEDWQRVNDERAALRRSLNEAEGKLGARPEEPAPPPTRPARAGDTVELVKMGTQATVLSVNKDGSLQLQAGILKITARQEEVRVVEGETQQSAKKVVARAEHKLRTLGASPEVDLRGMMTDEAIGALDLFLDNAVLGKLNEVRIIHGKGTGAVRKAVREHLKRSRYVKSFRPGRYGEGEDGVTIAELR